ncbi:MAG: Lin0512 family protein [Mogibacterium sp.]|nr:Lin0512 family protein [Mogibacterium sp.]
MAFKRLIIEIGQGVDMHGGDQNNAVLKATKDAIHHCCMACISEIFDIKDRKTEAKIHADIYVPHPEQADPNVVIDYLSGWAVDATVHQGGANPEGIALGDKGKTEITVALVVLTVYVDC